jgi:hypothetical protein
MCRTACNVEYKKGMFIAVMNAQTDDYFRGQVRFGANDTSLVVFGEAGCALMPDLISTAYKNMSPMEDEVVPTLPTLDDAIDYLKAKPEGCSVNLTDCSLTIDTIIDAKSPFVRACTTPIYGNKICNASLLVDKDGELK